MIDQRAVAARPERAYWFFCRVAALEGLPGESVRALAGASRVREAGSGEAILQIDEAPHAIVVIGEGRCLLRTVSRDGAPAVLRCFGPGRMLAAMPRGCYLEASAVRTVAYIVSYGSYLRIAAQYPEVGDAIGRALRAGSDIECTWRADLLTCDQRTCLAHLLSCLVEEGGGRDLEFTREQLAGMIGACRQRVGAWLAEFEAEGWILCRGGRGRQQSIAVLEPEALANL